MTSHSASSSLSLRFSTPTRTIPDIPIERLHPGMEATAALTGHLCDYSYRAAIEHYIRVYTSRHGGKCYLVQVECWSGREFKCRIQIRLGGLVRLSEWSSTDPDPHIGKPLIASEPSIDWRRFMNDEFWKPSQKGPLLYERYMTASALRPEGEIEDNRSARLIKSFRAPGLMEWYDKYKKV